MEESEIINQFARQVKRRKCVKGRGGPILHFAIDLPREECPAAIRSGMPRVRTLEVESGTLVSRSGQEGKEGRDGRRERNRQIGRQVGRQVGGAPEQALSREANTVEASGVEPASQTDHFVEAETPVKPVLPCACFFPLLYSFFFLFFWRRSRRVTIGWYLCDAYSRVTQACPRHTRSFEYMVHAKDT